MLPRRGEVWLFDLGMTAKTRPVLVVSVDYGNADRAIVTVVPHTTELRQSPFEVSVNASFLRQKLSSSREFQPIWENLTAPPTQPPT